MDHNLMKPIINSTLRDTITTAIQERMDLLYAKDVCKDQMYLILVDKIQTSEDEKLECWALVNRFYLKGKAPSDTIGSPQVEICGFVEFQSVPDNIMNTEDEFYDIMKFVSVKTASGFQHSLYAWSAWGVVDRWLKIEYPTIQGITKEAQMLLDEVRECIVNKLPGGTWS